MVIMILVELERFGIKQSSGELNSPQDGAVSKTICKTINW